MAIWKTGVRRKQCDEILHGGVYLDLKVDTEKLSLQDVIYGLFPSSYYCDVLLFVQCGRGDGGSLSTTR